MPITFTCPHSGHHTNVADHFAGQTGPCSACGQTITVPTLAAGPNVPPPRQRSTFGCAAGVIFGLIMFFLCFGLLPALVGPPGADTDAVRRIACGNNLDTIATAMSLYEGDHGCFPPAYTTGADGNRLHSWRTLLLPYLGEETLWESFELDEPWDSESNQTWHDVPLSMYQCPADSSGSPTDTNYVMIVGGEGLFDGGEPHKAVDVSDGVSQTILLVEVTGSGIHWMEPEDLQWDEIDFTINGSKSIRSEHEGGAHVMMCDGMVEFIAEDTPADQVRGLATPTGEEPAPDFLELVD
jgi:hypothetical protein